MWSLLLKWTVLRLALRSFGWLAILIPIALALKGIGLPVLMVLGTLALPVLVLLAIVGLPFIAVFVFGGVLLSILGAVLTLGLLAIKIVVPIVLVVWLVRWLFGGRDCGPDVVKDVKDGAEELGRADPAI